MAAAEERDGRNFRQTYYEKVGFKGVEEKRSLEMILNERPLDVNRLIQFTCRFNVPHVHRERVWLLLLGCPPEHESAQFIAEEQMRLTCDLEDVLHVMDLYSNKREHRGRVLTLMFMLEKGRLKATAVDQQLESPDFRCLLSIASNLTENCGQRFRNDYWILKEFVKLLNRINMAEVRERIESEVAAEEPLLYQHLKSTAPQSVIPCEPWLASCFAGFIAQPFLMKVWDKIVAGNAYKAMSFTGKSLFKAWKEDLLRCTDEAKIQTILLQKLPQDKSELLVKEVMSHLVEV